MSCINKSHPEFKTLLKNSKENPASLAADIGVWMDNNTSERFPTLEELGITPSRITADLKIIDVLPTLQRNVFSKDKIQGWLNDLQKKGVSATQLEMFREVAEPGMTKDDITVAIAANNSFAVEVNTSKETLNLQSKTSDSFTLNNNDYDKSENKYYKHPEDTEEYFISKYEISKDEYDAAQNTYGNTIKPTTRNTQQYSSLTVPGGTNYTENEIATPEITPNIKGHAQFSTDQGIGWFRSDEFAAIVEKEDALNEKGNVDHNNFTVKDTGKGGYVYLSKKSSKTRRILELQSDLFQKGRDKKDLIKTTRKTDNLYTYDGYVYKNMSGRYLKIKEGGGQFGTTIDITKEEYERNEPQSYNEITASKENQFLQLLNKKNNWVNFFIKSIIQDSTKKGYEKVLFPSGNTASKVEGHTTLEEFKKQKEDKIAKLEKELKKSAKDRNSENWFSLIYKIEDGRIKKIDSDSNAFTDTDVKTEEEAKEIVLRKLGGRPDDSYTRETKNNEIVQLKQELKKVETEGFGALKPIYNFYENRVTNALKKQGYNPVKVTDEFGNTWNEVTIEKERDAATIFYQRDSGKNAQKKARKIYYEEVQNKDLSQYDIGRINNKLKEISREIGDVDWNVRLSSKGNYYIAGYDNKGATFDTYFSPYADRAFSQLSSKEDPIGKGSKYNKLELKLKKWAKENGVSIRALESVVKEFPNRYQNNAIGISDFANSLIALADNRNADTLAEEVAHFAIEMMLDNQKGSVSFLGVQDVATLLQEVENTEIYQDVLKEYEGVYTKKLDFQKEALGKLLAIQLVNQFELGTPVEVDVQESENVFWQLLKLAGEAFQAFVEAVFGVNTSSRKNLENDLIPLAKSILKGETISQSQKFKGYTKADIKYQLNEELKNTPEVPKNISVSNKQIKSKEAFLETARKRLQIRLDQFDRGRPGSEKQVEKFQKVISDLERNIALKEWDVAVAQFINSAANNEETGELQILDRILDDVLDPDVDRSLSSNSIRDAREFLEMYEGLFADFKEQSYEAGFSKAQIKEFNEMINPITILIANSQKRMNVLERLDSVNSLTALNTDYNGETIDPDFNPKEIGETSTTDTSPYRLWSGNLKNAASGIVRSVHSMIFNSVAEIKRFVAYTARDILNSQTLFLTKYTQEDLIEKDSNGKLTQNIIQEHRMTDYYAEIRILKDNLAKKLNVKNEEGKYDYNKIVPELLSKEDQVIYKKTWSDFYENNSIQKEKTILKHTTNNEGKLVVKTKIIKFGETQYVTEDQLPGYLEKGYKVVTTKVTIPNNKYLNKDFKKLMQDPVFKSHYDLLIQTQRESVAKLPFKYQKDSLVYMNPSILKSMLDRFMANDISFLEKIKLLGQDAILIEEDDTQFGELNEYRKNAVPIFFTKKLDDISKLSFDIGRNIIMMSEMSENFRKMNMTAGKISNIESTIGNREYEKGRGKNKTLRPEKGVGTTDYETIKFLKETFVFGKEMNDWSTELEISEDNLFNKAIKKLSFGKIDMTGKHTLSWTKMISKFATYIRNGNLGFNAPTALTGQLTATGDSIIQDQIGLYTTNESKNFSRVVFGKEIPTVIAEMGNIKQTSKMHLLMLDNEVLKTENLIQDSGRGRLLRKANMSNAMYLLYSTGDYALKSRITVAIYDNYRLYNGKFLTRANFYIKTAEEQGVKNNKAHQKSVSSEWSDLRKQSLWNAYEQVDGKLIIKEEFKKHVTPELLNSVKGKIEHVTHNVDGTLSKTDKGKLAKTALGAFPLMHRGFIFNLLDRKFRKGRTNFITQEEEVGEYVATANFLGEGVKNLFTGNISTTGMAAAWQNLSPARKRGVYKTALDLIYLNFASLIAAMLLAAADEDDDEENWSLQFAALLSERWVLEVSAGWSINEFVQIVKEPVVGARIIEEISSITDVMFDDDPIESGMYKGKTKLNKWGVKRLPFGMKNLYELQYPSEKNKFIKKMVGPGIYYNDDEQAFSLGRWLRMRLGNGDTYNFGSYDDETKTKIIRQGIEELEQEEDYNGWN